ncbi:MAG: hypothetical protein SGJ07_07630 [Rhodospirillaceae bacterium]|nr:hypothetical protein [Rhodospirillaceae bacterium]
MTLKSKIPAHAGHCPASRRQRRRYHYSVHLSAALLALVLIATCSRAGETAERSYLACLPERLHPVSAQILDAFLEGRMTERDFHWGFHLPNSDYLPVT